MYSPPKINKILKRGRNSHLIELLTSSSESRAVLPRGRDFRDKSNFLEILVINQYLVEIGYLN